MLPSEDKPTEQEAQRSNLTVVPFLLLVIAVLVFMCLLQLMDIADALGG